jgi:hypothetical protein
MLRHVPFRQCLVLAEESQDATYAAMAADAAADEAGDACRDRKTLKYLRPLIWIGACLHCIDEDGLAGPEVLMGATTPRNREAHVWFG